MDDPADPDPDPVPVAAAWRPQGFGHHAVRAIRDPLIEPLWSGLRVLAAITAERAELFHEGLRLETPAQLRTELVAALLAEAVVAEGVLTPDALATGEGAFPEPEPITFRPGRLLLGSLGERRDRLAREREAAARIRATTGDGLRTLFDAPQAFVATDLLWLDGEPLLAIPLLERKRLLEASLGESALVRRTIFVRPSASGSLLAWRSLGFSQLAYKDANSRYRPGEENDGWAVAAAPSTAGRARSGP